MKNITILLVEDNLIDQELFRITLSDTDFNIDNLIKVGTLNEAKETLQKDVEIDLLLLDLFLPDSMGLQGLEDLQTLKPNLPIIILSGLDDRAMAVEAINKGAQDYIVKGEYGSELLDKSLKYALMRHHLKTERLFSEQKYLEGQEEERRRIAREIHDGIGQMLVAIKFKLASIDVDDKQYTTQTLDSVETLLEDAIEEARRVSENIVPRVLGKYGLRDSLTQLCNEVEKSSGLEIELVISEFQASGNRVDMTIYRLVQEALSNIMKHANASKVLVELVVKDSVAALRIQDNGDGFDEATVKRGNGLENMHQRASVSNGTCIISSIVGEGTTLKFTLPYQVLKTRIPVELSE